MNKDIGRYEVNIDKNSIRCFGIGFQYYPVFEVNDKTLELFVVANVLRIDVLFFFINIARYQKINWNEHIQ